MKKVWTWLRLLLSLGLIAFLLVSVDFGDLRQSLAQSDARLLALALLIALGDRVMMAYKWSVLLRAKNIHVPALSLTGTYLVSSFLGLFLPATVGGDAVRALSLTRAGHPGKDVISSIVVERLLGILALLVFVAGAIALSLSVLGERFFENLGGLFWIVLAVLAGLAGLILLSTNRRLLGRLAQGLARRQPGGRAGRLVGKLKDVYQSYVSYQDQKPVLAGFLGLSFVENLFPIFWTYALSLAFGLNVPLLYYFILVPIVLVLVRLPISIDGIGIQEGTFVYFLGLVGVSHSDALLLGIASHILAVISILPGGVLYGLSGLSVRKAGQSEPAAQSAEPDQVFAKEEEAAG